MVLCEKMRTMLWYVLDFLSFLFQKLTTHIVQIVFDAGGGIKNLLPVYRKYFHLRKTTQKRHLFRPKRLDKKELTRICQETSALLMNGCATDIVSFNPNSSTLFTFANSFSKDPRKVLRVLPIYSLFTAGS